jgi:hypothetical protein
MRPLLALSLIVVLAACHSSAQPQPPTTAVPEMVAVCEVPQRSALEEWLEELERVTALSPPEAQAELATLASLDGDAFERFRFALLNQRVGDSDHWIRSRDTLRDLIDSGELEPGQVQLAGALQAHSQAMINSVARRQQLVEELEAAQEQQRELAAKIEALTNLEQNISQRKSQEEAAPTPTPTPTPTPAPGADRDGS